MAEDLDDLGDLDDIGDLGDLDVGELGDEAGDGEEGGAKGGKKKLIIIAAAALLLVGGGAFFFLGSGSSDVQVAEGEEGEEGDDDEPKSTPYYFSLDPPFVVNFVGRGQARFLQVNIDGVTRDSTLKEDITLHLPHIRNNIVMLLSNKTYDELITAEGKESLRKEVLSELKKILRKETGKDEVEDVFFTSFVMQ